MVSNSLFIKMLTMSLYSLFTFMQKRQNLIRAAPKPTPYFLDETHALVVPCHHQSKHLMKYIIGLVG